MIEVSSNLKEFAKLTNAAGHKTYLVGGYVRNSLLGIGLDDVDIAGSMPVEDVETICGMAGFKTDVINKKLGTIQIVKDSDRYEYTQFRREEYDDTGKHSPDEVEFVSDPKDDAVRRDFTINAFYYDILKGKLLDYFDGETDLKRKRLKAVVSPEKVFDADGLRILRLIRFTCELGFKIDPQTYKVAKVCAYKVKDISRERILKEIKIAINGGLKYQLKNQTHGNVIKYFNDLNLWQYIFEGNFANFKVKQSGKLYKAYLNSDGSNRFVAFMCLVLFNYIKALSSENNIAFSVNQLLGKTGLKESNKNMQEIYDAYWFAQKLMFLPDHEVASNKNCLAYDKLPFNVKNYLHLVNKNKVDKVKLRIMEMKKLNVPFSEDELLISNKDLIEKIKVKEQHVSKIKSTLYEMCVTGMIINDKDILVEQAKFLNEKLLKILADANKRAYAAKEKAKQAEPAESPKEVKEEQPSKQPSTAIKPATTKQDVGNDPVKKAPVKKETNGKTKTTGTGATTKKATTKSIGAKTTKSSSTKATTKKPATSKPKK